MSRRIVRTSTPSRSARSEPVQSPGVCSAELENTITRWIDVDRGGHFAALEEPVMLTADIRDFFRDLR